MAIGKICSRVVATASPTESIELSAQRMKEHGVGTLVVVSESQLPEGILTDRDIVVRCVAAGLDPATTPVSEIMSSPVREGHEALPLDEALDSMQAQGARRLLVTDDDGKLVGILALDDILDLMAYQAERIGTILRSQNRTVLAASGGRTRLIAPRME